ncbi:MAG: DUF362 domain-containing protein [Ignavibacteriales bacterium]|nr:DUF362 domain-containing protein [Ignavibacteriales bacterium]
MIILNLLTSVFALRKAGKVSQRGTYSAMTIFFTVVVTCFCLFSGNSREALYAQVISDSTIEANKPLGVERGIFPGRVVWVHDTNVAKWDGTKGNWWDDANTSQTETDKMLPAALTLLTGEKDQSKAWNALFRYFNKLKKNKDEGYLAHQKIAIKINENNTYSHSDDNELNASPQMVFALVRSLVKDAGVPQKYITVFDASRFITNNVFNKCHAEFPDVIFIDNAGNDGRVKTTYVENAILYSIDNGQLAKGLATCAVEADYLINMALLKGHVGQGVTLCAKNYYGVTSINSDWRKNAHNNFDQNRNGKPKYMTFVDFMGHKDLGEKTLLFLVDGLYGSKSVAGPPSPKWKMSPFNNSWAGSLFASQDGVAIDAVGLDFLSNEWPDAPDMKYSDNYLIEAALANDPPSKTFYDPERDQVRCISLGVMEHWNNAVEKKYSRNLGKNYGIELVHNEIND